MKLLPLFATLALALPFAQPALAIPFSRVDRNNDGTVTFAEARSVMNRLSEVHFDTCDRDGDGVLTRSEFHCLSGIYDALYLNRNR